MSGDRYWRVYRIGMIVIWSIIMLLVGILIGALLTFHGVVS